MSGSLCNDLGEKGILVNVEVTVWCDVHCIPSLDGSASKREGGRLVQD